MVNNCWLHYSNQPGITVAKSSLCVGRPAYSCRDGVAFYLDDQKGLAEGQRLNMDMKEAMVTHVWGQGETLLGSFVPGPQQEASFQKWVCEWE